MLAASDSDSCQPSSGRDCYRSYSSTRYSPDSEFVKVATKKVSGAIALQPLTRSLTL
ncbi:MAG: hypothetical protein MUE44_30500 [Oscillatoriaceae cyanobacterium Prado104]|nr:hypothetical protein [Oscillatoriaceae cyanobacterium Prado104]